MNRSSADLDEQAAPWSELRHSVFSRLVVTMATMAVCLLLLVGAFFFFVVGPNVHTSVDHVVDAYVHTVANSGLDLDQARQLATRLNIQVRYEGASGSWSTHSGLPSMDDVQHGVASRWRGSLVPRSYAIVDAPQGGRYLFVWSVGSRLSEIHNALVLLLLIVMAIVVITTYLVLNRLLAPLRALNDGVSRLSAGDLDVTLPRRTRDEFGRLTDAFNRMVGRVRAMIQSRDQLLIDVSHELRSPVTRMKVALELIPPSAQRAGMAEDLAEMEAMIAELLELERLRSGQGLQRRPQDLVLVLRDAAAPFADRAPGVRLQLPTHPLVTNIDAGKIRSVIRNLLENAAKYSLRDSGPVEITATRTGGWIHVRIADDGPGIPDADADRVFEPFYRADPSRSKATGGYGLGLSICQRVMQAHGGDIGLERNTPRGCVFQLTLRTAEAD